jgi:hypothetical protein
MTFLGRTNQWKSSKNNPVQPVNPAIPNQLGGFYDDCHHKSARTNIL